MRACCWRAVPSCPPFEALRWLRLRYIGFDGAQHLGELIVHAELAPEVVAIFEELFEARFPIHSMRRIDELNGDDNASMAANNTSCFNFRVVDGTNQLSLHALGRAIDINPVQNPWVRSSRVDPTEGKHYLDRTHVRPGMIVRPGLVIHAFERAGWQWGGDLANPDYHHFSKI
jgi:poly-gamma-glutamate synthesis protein (capsule biosynthesis protein)